MTKLRTAIGYIRVSTAGQADNGDSLDDQRARITGYCRAHQLQLTDVIEDAGHSGSTIERPGFRRVLAAIRARSVKAVVVCKLDRLTRSLRDLGLIIELVEAKDVQLCSISDSIDTKTAGGRLVLNVLGSVVQWQREAIAERTKEVLAHKRARGEQISRFAPYGYFQEDGRWEEHPHEQKGCDLIRQLRIDGTSYRDISTILARRGYHGRNGNPLSASVIMRVLKRGN